MLDWPAALDATSRLVFWTILVGLIANSTCAMLGCFLVLRKMSMLGDALSHAVLPGLVIAFLLTGSTASIPMFIGAMLFAMLTAGLTRLATTHGEASEDAGLGIVFTSFFALGILLVQLFAEKVHIDRDVVLEGAIEYVALDTAMFLGVRWPASLLTTSIVLATVLLWLFLFWKEIKAAIFDPDYAAAIGLSGQTMLAMVVILVSICVVASFKIVGSILVVAMLIVPGAAAQLLTHRLWKMLVIAVALASVSTIVGYLIAWEWNTSAAGMMAVITGFLYAGALTFSPDQGLIAQRLRERHFQQRIRLEDALGILFRWEENEDHAPSLGPTISEISQLSDDRFNSRTLKRLEKEGLLERSEERYHLTSEGKKLGRRIVRGHRLWESYLETEFQLPEDHLHEAAHQMEHYLDHRSRQQIEQQLGSPESDPHGRTIPPPSSE